MAISDASRRLLDQRGAEVVPDLLALYGPGDRHGDGMGLLTMCLNACHAGAFLGPMLAAGHWIQPERLGAGAGELVAGRLLRGDLSGVDLGSCFERGAGAALGAFSWPSCDSKADLMAKAMARGEPLPENLLPRLFSVGAAALVSHPGARCGAVSSDDRSSLSDLAGALVVQAARAVDMITRDPAASMATMRYLSSGSCQGHLAKWLAAMDPTPASGASSDQRAKDFLARLHAMADANAVAAITASLEGRPLRSGRSARV